MRRQIITDVCVAGGGLAGVCAALAAARQGKKVVLIQNRPVLGGNSSSEIRVWTRGSSGGGNIYSEEMGILGEMKMRNLFVNPDGSPILWDEVMFDTVMAEKNITLLLNTFVYEVEAQNGEIAALNALEISSENSYCITAGMYIDATGDGAVGAKSGVDFAFWKESCDEYGEKLAPKDRENTRQGNTLLLFTKTTKEKNVFRPLSYAYTREHIQKIIDKGGRVANEKMNGCDYWWIEYGGMLDTIGDVEEITLELKKLVFGLWDYIKNSGKFDTDHLALEWVGKFPGKRESRRFKTNYILTLNDVLSSTDFYDSVFYGGWFIDFHPCQGIYSEKEFCEQIPVNVYNIPLRCLYSSKVKNLFFAGRNIGVSHAAFASSRVMNTCALSGQAAGTAAAVLLTNGKNIDGIANSDVDEIIRLILKDDGFIPGRRCSDPQNLIESATVTASSTVSSFAQEQTGRLNLDKNLYIVLSKNCFKNAKVLFSAEKDTQVKAKIYSAPIPSKNCFNKQCGETVYTLKKGTHYLALDVPVQADGFISVVLEPADGVAVAVSDRGLTGILCGYCGSNKVHYPVITLGSFSDYCADNIKSGYNRCYKTPNLWISGNEESPYLEIEWESEKNISELRLLLNPDLALELFSSRTEEVNPHHNAVFRTGMPEVLVKEFVVEAMCGGNYKLVYEETQNYKRMPIIKMQTPVKTQKLRITFKQNHSKDCKHAEVFGVAVY